MKRVAGMPAFKTRFGLRRGGRTCALFLAALCLHAQIPAGAVGTVAGTGVNGYSDGGNIATAARIDLAYGVAVDAWGNLFIADTWNHRIRQVRPDGTIRVIAGIGTEGFFGDGRPAVVARLSFPRGLAVDAWGNVYFSDSGNGVIRKVLVDGTIQTVAGNGRVGDSGDGGPAIQAAFRVPRGLAVDQKGNLYIADGLNFRIRKVDTGGRIATYAGDGFFGYSGDGGRATFASIGFVHSLVIDAAGVLYFSDVAQHCIRRVRTDGVIETVAGTGQPGFSGDGGPATSGKLSFPRGLALGSDGALYVADSGNHRIRRISADGRISTVAGTGISGFGGDSGKANQAVLNYPYGLASDPRGNVIIADLLNYRVRKARFETLLERPKLAQPAAVSGASFRPPISPGSLISVFGSNFANGQSTPAATPLAPSLAGTSVLVDGQPIPMVFVSPGQLNAQLPWAGLGSTARLKVNFGGMESDEVTVPVATTSPALFTYGENRAVAQNQNYSVNGPDNAAARGSTIVLYATGLGPVTPAQADGEAAPLSPLARTPTAPAVSIGGQSARVSFSGLSPGFVGLWQINAEVPQSAPVSAAVPVKVAIGGVESTEAVVALK